MNLLNLSQDKRRGLLHAAHRNDHQNFKNLLVNLAEQYSVSKGEVLLSCSSDNGSTTLHKAAEYDHTGKIQQANALHVKCPQY